MIGHSDGSGANRVETLGLCKSFGRAGEDLEVLREINLDIPGGEFVSIVGASGCGKSTFLRLVDGLIPASSGSVRVGGNVVTEPGPDRGFVFQQDNLFPWRTVLDNVMLGLLFQKRMKDHDRATAKSLLELVGLRDFEGHYPHELSGGMRQRVNLARALAIDPQVLLMDEPFAALDAQTREIMQAELMRTWEATRKTVLFVTHQIDEAVYLSDRVLVFTVRPGRIKADIRIDLPRPRELSIKRTPAFTEYCDEIWRLIEEEVRESMGLEIQQALESHRAGTGPRRDG